DPVLQQWSYRIMYEGSFPRHPDATLDVHRVGFYMAGDARRILRAGETPSALFIMGSKYSPVVRHSSTYALATPPPTYSAIGGTITYRHGWRVGLHLQAWYTSNTAAG